MPDPSVPRVIAVTERFRRELLAQERSASTRMVKAYGGIWARLFPRLEALTQEIDARTARGQVVSQDWLQQQTRYQDLLAQILQETARFVSFADLSVQGLQQDMVAAAPEHARELTGQALPRGLGFRELAELGLEWNTLPAEAVQDLVGRLGDGSPLKTLLDAIPGDVTASVGDALLNGVAQGWSPRKTAQVVRSETGMGLSRALRVSRTESLRSYRVASRRQYQLNSRIVPKWRRHAAKNARTCMACLVLDGTEYANQDDMDDHVQGRCAMVPVTISYRDLGIPVDVPPIEWESGRKWFERQPENVQAQMMGSGMFTAWKDGKFDLSRLPKLHKDKIWGNAWTTASLKDMLAAKPAGPGPAVVAPSKPVEPTVLPAVKTAGPQGMAGAREFAKDSDAVSFASTHWPKGATTAEETDALRRYQGAGYQGINPHLRGKAFPSKRVAELKSDIQVLDKVLARQTVPEDMIVYRGVNGSAFPQLSEQLAGRVIEEKGYLSTAVGSKIPTAFADKQVMMRIRVPAGTPGYFMPSAATDARMRAERELLLGRGQKMLIHSMKYNSRSGKWLADVELLG